MKLWNMYIIKEKEKNLYISHHSFFFFLMLLLFFFLIFKLRLLKGKNVYNWALSAFLAANFSTSCLPVLNQSATAPTYSDGLSFKMKWVALIS